MQTLFIQARAASRLQLASALATSARLKRAATAAYFGKFLVDKAATARALAQRDKKAELARREQAAKFRRGVHLAGLAYEVDAAMRKVADGLLLSVEEMELLRNRLCVDSQTTPKVGVRAKRAAIVASNRSLTDSQREQRGRRDEERNAGAEARGAAILGARVARAKQSALTYGTRSTTSAAQQPQHVDVPSDGARSRNANASI